MKAEFVGAHPGTFDPYQHWSKPAYWVDGVVPESSHGLHSKVDQTIGGSSFEDLETAEKPAAVRHSHKSPSYTFTTLDPPDARFTNTTEINGRGEVAGSYSDASGTHGFAYDHGTLTPINVTGATSTVASAINGRGEVAGSYSDGSGSHGFIDDNGAFTTFDVPGAVSITPSAINNRGEVVGSYTTTNTGTPANPPQSYGFVYNNGTVITIKHAYFTGVSDINNHGEFVGTDTGHSSSPPSFPNGPSSGFTSSQQIRVPGATSTVFSAINDRSEVAGSYSDGSGSHGFIDDNGAFTTFDVPGATSIRVSAINDSGEVVGTYSAGLVQHGFLYDKGNVSTIDAPGARNTNVSDINNRGDIAGVFTLSTDSGGTLHGFLATLGNGHCANQFNISDLLPCTSAMDGGSHQSANAFDMMDQTPAVGASFASFGDLGSAQAAPSVLSSDGWLRGASPIGALW